MAVAIGDSVAGGAAVAANTINVTFASAQPGDLILFCMHDTTGTLPGLASDWLVVTGAGAAAHVLYGHVVQAGETSFAPFTGTHALVYTAYWITGVDPTSPWMSPITRKAPVGSGTYDGTTLTAPSPGSLMMKFGFQDGASVLTSAVDWNLENQQYSPAVAPFTYIMTDVAMPQGVGDSGTTEYPILWTIDPGSHHFYEISVVLQALPVDLSPEAGYGVVRRWVAAPLMGLQNTHLGYGFQLPWTPTPGNMLVAAFLGTIPGTPTMQSGWNSVLSGYASFIASRVVQVGDTNDFSVAAASGMDAGFFVFVFELSGFSAIAAHAGTTMNGPDLTTPSEIVTASPVFALFFAASDNGSFPPFDPTFAMLDKLSSGDSCASYPGSGLQAPWAACAERLSRGSGTFSAEFDASAVGTSSCDALTLLFAPSSPACPVPYPTSTQGPHYPTGVPDARIIVYNADGTVAKMEARDDLAGGSAVYEDTPSGCGACTLNLGISWEDMTTGYGSGSPYWIGRNLVEIYSYNDVVQADLGAPGATKIYVGSRYGYDPAVGHDQGMITLDDPTSGLGVTRRIPVTGVGTDSGGDYITVGAPVAGGTIPAYTAGARIFRRRYKGIIMKRGLWNSRAPKGQITCTGLAQYLTEAYGSFAVQLDDIGSALYNCISQFASRWPNLTINSANFPVVGQAYSGSNDNYQLSNEISQILSGGISDGSTWVIRVGHDGVVRLIRVYSQPCLAYDYPVTVHQSVTDYEALSVQATDEDVSQFYNSIEVTGDTDPTTKQPYAAIVQDPTSISLFGQVDGAPVSNTSCKSDDDCAAYGQALLNDNAIPRNSYQFRVYTRQNDHLVPSPPLGLSRGDCVLGVSAVTVDNFQGTAASIVGLVMTVQTTIDVANADMYQDVKFAQVEPNWNAAIAERTGKLKVALRHNVLPSPSVDSYMVGPASNGYTYSPTSLALNIPSFKAAFNYGVAPLVIPPATLTLNPNASNHVWLDKSGTWHVQTDSTPVADALKYGIFQTSSSGIVGDMFKAVVGPLEVPKTWFKGDLELTDLADVDIASVHDIDVLAWSSSDKKWENTALESSDGSVTIARAGVKIDLKATGGGGGGGAPWPPFTIVQDALSSNMSTGPGSSVTATFSNGGTATTGDTLIAIVAMGNSTPTTPSGWTKIIDLLQDDARIVVFMKTAAGTETGITVTSSAGDWFSLRLMEISGTKSLDASATNGLSSPGDIITFPALTPSSNSMVFAAACFCSPGGIAMAFPSMWIDLSVPGIPVSNRSLAAAMYRGSGSGSPIISPQCTTGFGVWGSHPGTATAMFSIR